MVKITIISIFVLFCWNIFLKYRFFTGTAVDSPCNLRVNIEQDYLGWMLASHAYMTKYNLSMRYRLTQWLIRLCGIYSFFISPKPIYDSWVLLEKTIPQGQFVTYPANLGVTFFFIYIWNAKFGEIRHFNCWSKFTFVWWENAIVTIESRHWNEWFCVAVLASSALCVVENEHTKWKYETCSTINIKNYDVNCQCIQYKQN